MGFGGDWDVDGDVESVSAVLGLRGGLGCREVLQKGEAKRCVIQYELVNFLRL